MNRYTYVLSAVSLVLAVLVTGCATTTIKQQLTISSNPSGAEVMVRNSDGAVWHWGLTPVSKPVTYAPAFGMQTENTLWITADLDGYTKQTKIVTMGTAQIHFTLTPKERRETGVQQQQQQQQQTVVIPSFGSGGERPPKGFVAIVSEQKDAEVYVDGVFSGNCPANLRLSQGIHIIEIKKTGYQNYRREIRILGDSELTLRVKLKPSSK